MKHLYCILTFSLLAVYLNSCGTCDCFDEFDAQVSFTFKIDSANQKAFQKGELDSCRFITKMKTDSGFVILNASHYLSEKEDRYLSFYNDYDEALDGGEYRDPLTYQILNDSPKIDLTINNIYIKGSKGGRMNCKCYTNEFIKFDVNGINQTYQGSDRSGANYYVQKP